MNHRSHDLMVVTTATAFSVAVALVGLTVLEMIGGLALVLVLPGYALTAALFPWSTLSGEKRFLFSLGLSLALTALGGFVLHWTPWGISPESWAVLLGGMTLLGCGIAFARRLGQPAEPGNGQASSTGNPSWFFALVTLVGASLGIVVLSLTRWRLDGVAWVLLLSVALFVAGMNILLGHRAKFRGYARLANFGLEKRQVLLFGCALAIGVSAIGIARTGAMWQPTPGFTQLWLLPTENIQIIQLGVRNYEAEELEFRVELRQGDALLKEWTALSLAPDESWDMTVDLGTQEPGDTPVEARLIVAEHPGEIYRRATLYPERASRP
jgi:hypothetical protein